jgi:hypothetical protein
VAKVGYSVNTSTAIVLTATTAKTIVAIRAGATFGIQVVHYEVSFTGVTASEGPVYCELCYCTFATNSTPGTGNTSESGNIRNKYGRVLASGMTAFSACTSEPTVLTTYDDFLLDPNKGVIMFDYSLGQEPDSALNEGFAIRVTSASGSTPSVRASLGVERI